MLENNQIRLRALEEEDLDQVKKWRFDNDNYDYFYEFTPTNNEQHHAWFTKSCADRTEINFIIESTGKDYSKIGIISLVNIDYRNQKAEMGRVLIGDKNMRRKGLGAEAIRLLLDYAFYHLNLQKIICEVFSDNKNAIAVYEKLSFIKEGELRKHIYKKGEFKDITIMAIFRK